MNEFANIGLSLITPSLTNPRKDFNPATLAELTDSIKASGVHQPVLVRFLPGHRTPDTNRDVIYELVAGERRLRACRAAGLSTIPAMIRPLTDDQVLEIQIVENLQRDDLSALEEAEGYEQLMQHSGINADEVATKIGKSRTYVFNRRKLLDLSPECKTAIREGQIDASRALLIARIPDSKLQLKALAEAQRKDFRGEVPSVRSFQTWLKQNVMLYLENAVFKITDARLIADAGSCNDCPKRTGANPDLFVDVDSADVCTDPVCFHAKEEAHRARLRAQAEKKGIRLIEGAEAKELIPHQYNNFIRGYTKLDTVRLDVKPAHEGKRLRELLGDNLQGVVLIENPHTKELIEAVPDDVVEAALAAKGMLHSDDDDDEPDTPESTGHLQQKIDNLKRRFEPDQQREKDKALTEATIQAVLAADERLAKALLGPTILRAWLGFVLDTVPEQYMARALGYTFQDGEEEMDALVQYIKSCSLPDLSRAVVLCMLHEENQYGGNDVPILRDTLATVTGVDAKTVHAKAVKTVKARYADEIKALQSRIDAANALKQPQPTPPLAQPANAEKQSDKKPGKPATRKPKLSAEDAMSGIASAMQEEERAQTTATEAQHVEQAQTDPLLEKAIEVIVREGKVSVRLLKSNLSIGQNKAVELIDKLQDAGKVSAVDATGARKVLVAAWKSSTTLIR